MALSGSPSCDCGSSPVPVAAKGNALQPAFERSLRRAIKGLLDRGDILVIKGEGGPGDPRHYVTVEWFASAATGETVKDTAHAKAFVAELSEVEASQQRDRCLTPDKIF
jgi:hypothetical protein